MCTDYVLDLDGRTQLMFSTSKLSGWRPGAGAAWITPLFLSSAVHVMCRPAFAHGSHEPNISIVLEAFWDVLQPVWSFWLRGTGGYSWNTRFHHHLCFQRVHGKASPWSWLAAVSWVHRRSLKQIPHNYPLSTASGICFLPVCNQESH